jgi:hypothetical protein
MAANSRSLTHHIPEDMQMPKVPRSRTGSRPRLMPVLAAICVLIAMAYTVSLFQSA